MIISCFAVLTECFSNLFFGLDFLLLLATVDAQVHMLGFFFFLGLEGKGSGVDLKGSLQG